MFVLQLIGWKKQPVMSINGKKKYQDEIDINSFEVNILLWRVVALSSYKPEAYV